MKEIERRRNLLPEVGILLISKGIDVKGSGFGTGVHGEGLHQFGEIIQQHLVQCLQQPIFYSFSNYTSLLILSLNSF